MRFGVIGPVVAEGGRAEADLGGRTARALLALLVARHPAEARRDWLEDQVWHGARTSDSALRVQVLRLRRALADCGLDGLIRTTPNGYVLDLGEQTADEAIDLHRFESLVEQGIAARTRRRPADARALLEEALGLWRGEPFEGLDIETLEPVRRRLELRREDALEHLAACLLEQDLHEAAVRLLEGVADGHIERERLTAMWMLALVRLGRPAEALRAAERLRERLQSELGVDPGDEVRAVEEWAREGAEPAGLEARLLRSHALVEASAPTHLGFVRPPADGIPIVGRTRDLERGLELLGRHRAVALVGPPGVGKTRLAQELCRFVVEERLATSVAWVDLQNADDPVRALSRALGLEPQSAVQRIRQVLAEHLPFVVFDNAEDLVVPVGELVGDLQRRLPDLLMAITTTVRPQLAVCHEVRPLAVPSDECADDASAPSLELLRRELAEAAPGVALSHEEASAICRLCGGLPLALRLVASELRVVDSDVVRRASHVVGSSRLEDRLDSVIGRLRGAHRAAFRAMALLPGDFGFEVARAASGLDDQAFAEALVDLADRCLVEVAASTPRRFRVLPPLRAYVARRVDPEEERAVASRIADHCQSEARRLSQVVLGGDTDEIAERDTADLLSWVRIAIAHHRAERDPERAFKLNPYLDPILYSRGWWHEKNELLDLSLSIPGPPSVGRARALTLRGRHGLFSSFDLARLRQAHEMGLALDAPKVAAFALHIAAIHRWWRGEVREAIADHLGAMDTFRAMEMPRDELEALKFAGVAQVHLGEVDEGLRRQRDSLARVGSLGFDFGVAHGLGLLGHSHRHLGDDEAARVCFEEAAAICARLGNRGTAIHVHVGLAAIACERGEFDRADAHAAQSLRLSAASHLYAYEPWAWVVAMRSAWLDGRVDEAMRCGARALDALPQAPSGESVRVALELATLAHDMGDHLRAARLAGSASVLADRPEMPIVPRAELARRERLHASLDTTVGALAEAFRLGARCTPREAAGEFVRPPG